MASKVFFMIINFVSSLNFAVVKTKLFRMAQIIPLVKKEINKELDKMTNDCTKKFSDKRKGNTILTLPKEGMPKK